MNRCPEPRLTPPEAPPPSLRCGLCSQPKTRLLELPYGLICRSCLTDAAHTLDDLSALLCAPIVAQEPTPDQGGTP